MCTATSESTIMAALLLVFAAILSVEVVAAAKTPVITYGIGQETCPSTEQRKIAMQELRENIYQYLSNGSILPQCGEGTWYRVAYLNMTDPSQQCPCAWRELKYNTNQFRACGRPVSSVASRPSQIFPISHQYSKVCGRVIGIQVASPDAFHSERSIDQGYIDGVSITHGSPRHHIWSYVGGYSEITTSHLNACPCDYSGAIQPQSFVSSNYYCESGNPFDRWYNGQVYRNDKLWDGELCSHEGTCCTGTNTPPWFSVNLGSPTSDDIEVRIMGSESTDNEDTPIELLEFYVQ
jgi:hypothetical protein